MEDITEEQIMGYLERNGLFSIFNTTDELLVLENIKFKDLPTAIGWYLDSVPYTLRVDEIAVYLQLDFMKQKETTVRLGEFKGFKMNQQNDEIFDLEDLL